MRFEGTITSWNDTRGFGFIEPLQGGQAIFVHIKAFTGAAVRPQLAQQVSFQIERGPGGRQRAIHVALLTRPMKASVKARAAQPAPWGMASVLAIAVLLLMLAAVYIWSEPTRWALWIYPLASAVTVWAYGLDKAAARQGRWRMPENTLHWLALVGGWPGALWAQHHYRHKSSKTKFLVIFWCTVVLNLAGLLCLAWLCGRAWTML